MILPASQRPNFVKLSTESFKKIAINSKIPLCGEVQVAIKSIFYNLNLNDTIRYLAFSIQNFSPIQYWYWYLIEHPYQSKNTLRQKKKRCLFPFTLPTLMFGPYPYLSIAQNIFILKSKVKVCNCFIFHAWHPKELKKERRKHQISAYNTSSVDLNISRYPTTLNVAILLYVYI